MHDRTDVEARSASDDARDIDDSQHAETESLLPTTRPQTQSLLSVSPVQSKFPYFPKKSGGQYTFGVLHVSIAFVLGALACFVAQAAICRTNCLTFKARESSSKAVIGDTEDAFAPPYVGSTSVDIFPPANPTNAYPSLFPTSVGYAGETPTGVEPAVIATAPAYPKQTGQCSHQLLVPKLLEGQTKGQATFPSESVGFKKKPKFNLFNNWGNLSPWFSVGQKRFGVDSSPLPPETCRITGLHFLHRHGARYPTAPSGPANFATKLHQSPQSWNATGELSFLNDWTYKLGEEILTPFGRQQLYDLGISIRMKYGFLLQNFTEQNTIPVFRTESQDRMLASALNFAMGFFGYPLEGKYQQSITIESNGFNNTLAPYDTCPNANIDDKSNRGSWYINKWTAIYLKDAHRRLRKQFKGFNLTINDVYSMQQICPYETVALGYSKFCELFTEDEWEGFNYSLDLHFWYGSAFGSPVGRVQGIGYVQELVARLTHTPIETHNSSTNATLDDNPITFPLGQSLYVDATHEVVVLNIITALNLTSFAESGPLPYTHIPHERTFRSAELAPFATNVQFQLLECTSLPGPQIRIIINDGVAPLTGIRGCPEQKDGMCPVDIFVTAQKEIIGKTDWEYDCYGNWTVPAGTEWETVTGDPPKP